MAAGFLGEGAVARAGKPYLLAKFCGSCCNWMQTGFMDIIKDEVSAERKKNKKKKSDEKDH